MKLHSASIWLLTLVLGCGVQPVENKKKPEPLKVEDKTPPATTQSLPASEKAASAPSTAASPSPSMTAAQRIEAWKKKLPSGWKVFGEKGVGSFIYAAAATQRGDDEPTGILATNWGETEAPVNFDRLALMFSENPNAQMPDIKEVGDLDGDGKAEIIITYSLGAEGGLILYLDKPQGPQIGTEITGPSSGAPTTHNGKPAVNLKIIDTAGDEKGDFHDSKEVLFWNGKEFVRE